MPALHVFPVIHLHKAPVDGRRQNNGFATIVQTEMKLDPFAEALFVFVSRIYDNIKLLYWNIRGFALWLYRLEREKFRWPRKWDGDTVSLTSEQLGWLLDGYDIMRMKPSKQEYSAVRDIRGLHPDAHSMVMSAQRQPDGDWLLQGCHDDFDTLMSDLWVELEEELAPKKNRLFNVMRVLKHITPEEEDEV